MYMHSWNWETIRIISNLSHYWYLLCYTNIFVWMRKRIGISQSWTKYMLTRRNRSITRINRVGRFQYRITEIMKLLNHKVAAAESVAVTWGPARSWSWCRRATVRGASSESRRARDAEDVLLTQIGESRASAPLCRGRGGAAQINDYLARPLAPRYLNQ